MTMKIDSLLNPLSEEQQQEQDPRCSSEPLTPFEEPRQYHKPEKPKRQKASKVAAIFIKAKAKEPVRYPPHEGNEDADLLAEHKKFRINPLGHIKDYCRHIPYNSEKKLFFEKTGREALEVYQYEFFMPGDDRDHVVMWDYNIGLVRVTPFFKACKYSKTTPARVLNINQGLRDLSHSITGGALAAQGYWMPYDTAKAVAATFCYEIRAALTPVFGVNFMHECILPGDPGFGSFNIDRAITRHSAAQAHTFRLLYSSSKDGNVSSGGNSPSMGMLAAPPLPPPIMPSNAGRGHNTRSGRGGGKTRTLRQRRTADAESGYGTDTDQSDRYMCSPVSTITSQGWTSVNGVERAYTPSPKTFVPQLSPWLSSVPRSLPALPPTSTLSSMRMTPAPETIVGMKRRIEEVEVEEAADHVNDDGDTGDAVPVNDNEEQGAEEHAAEAEEANEADHEDSEPEYALVGHSGRQRRTAETDAALALLMLSGNDTSVQEAGGDGHRDKRSRRASV